MNTKTAIGWGLWCLLCMPAFAAKTAIVIGNSNYVSSQDRLINPKNDAQAIAKRLDELGYDTQLILNADLEKMLAALNRLPRDPEGTVLFYYAGHGVQIDQRNYLVPVDARMDNRDMVERQTIAVREVLDKLHRTQAAQRVVILDACRNDPFPKAYRSGARGLSRESIPASKGQMILYAASADEVADDGRGQHGVFTQALLAQLQTPNLELPKLFDRVAEEVNRNTQGRQNPYTEGGQGLSSFVFYRAAAEETPKPPVVERVVERVVEKPVERIVERNPHAAEIVAWNAVKSSSRASDYQSFLRSYPSGLFAEAAQLKLNQFNTNILSKSDLENCKNILRKQYDEYVIQQKDSKYLIKHFVIVRGSKAQTEQIAAKLTDLLGAQISAGDDKDINHPFFSDYSGCIAHRSDILGTAEGAQCLASMLGDGFYVGSCKSDGFPYNLRYSLK